MTPFELAQALRNAIIIRAAEVFTYHKHWTAEFSKSQLIEIVERLKRSKRYFSINPEDFTESEMISLGFMKMTESCSDYLIPLWILPFLDENHPTVIKCHHDIDHRMGCLAYGVVPKKETP